MDVVQITINGVDYPCRPTMGALLRFKKETGKEITEITENSVSDLITYLYCCVASASAVDKKDFDMNLIEFADALNSDDLDKWSKAMQGTTTKAKAEKKR